MSVAQPVARPVVRGVTRSVLGGGLAPALALLTPRDDGTIDSDIVRGVSPTTFTRDSTAYVQDWEGIYRLIPAEVARFKGCRWEPATNTFHWQLADGTPLHPVRVVDGVRIFDHYRRWEASTDYAVGDRIIPDEDSGTAGGNGYWYQCTTAGTSGASQPTWPTATFGADTVVDGGATWTLKGYYRVAGYYTEGARTNSVLDSRALDSSNWDRDNSDVTVTQDAVGIDGVANTAFTVTDNTAGNFDKIQQTVTIPNDSNTHAASVYVGVDPAASVFPEVQLTLGTDEGQNFNVQLNTATGETFVRNASPAGSSHTVARASENYWKVTIILPNDSTGRTTARMELIPAVTTALDGSISSNLTGSAVFDQAQVELDVGGNQFGTSPIVTTTAAVTRAADVSSFDGMGHVSEAQGTAVADCKPVAPARSANMRIIQAIDRNGSFLLSYRVTDGVSNRDGSNFLGGPDALPDALPEMRGASRWSGSHKAVAAAGVTGDSGPYDGSYNTENWHIGLDPYNEPLVMFGTIRNLRIYTRDVGEARLKALSDYD